MGANALCRAAVGAAVTTLHKRAAEGLALKKKVTVRRRRV